MTAGGYQRPNNPAPVSGPGPLSARTDNGPASKQAARYVAGGDYGDGGLMGIQQGAPMAATPTLSGKPQSGVSVQPQDQVVPLTAPSQFPNQPVTHGADAGPGPGSDSLGLPPQAQQGGATAKQVVQTLASHPDASPELKQLATLLGG